ncbi:hypothetical protein ACFFP0_26280 [Rhizobium puerariae]|uniref:Uncharacterized protein n=1 Tax=Rhizobium puerariae TaxID=1585791 RepID=A0ABV6AP17_9HYPH
MTLTLKSGFLTSSGYEGRLIMSTGAGDQVVVVTHDALAAIADPPRVDEFRLQEYIEAFSRIASDKFDGGIFDATGHVCVTADDVRKWRSSPPQLH